MADDRHVYVSCDTRASFAEIRELLTQKAVQFGEANGHVVSVSHSFDPNDPDGTPYSLIMVAEAPEELRAESAED